MTGHEKDDCSLPRQAERRTGESPAKEKHAGAKRTKEKLAGGNPDREKQIKENPTEEKTAYGTVYDDVFRTMIDRLPHLTVPLINEVFSKQYAGSEPVTALQNEHMEIMDGKVITDSYLKIADRYYHIECQSNPDGTMAIRMIEYDFLIALKHAEKTGNEYTIDFPQSCVLYLRYTDHTPDFLVVHVRFPGGAKAEYRTPIIKVGQYGLDDIFRSSFCFFFRIISCSMKTHFRILKRMIQNCRNCWRNISIFMGNLKNCARSTGFRIMILPN